MEQNSRQKFSIIGTSLLGGQNQEGLTFKGGLLSRKDCYNRHFIVIQLSIKDSVKVMFVNII